MRSNGSLAREAGHSRLRDLKGRGRPRVDVLRRVVARGAGLRNGSGEPHGTPHRYGGRVLVSADSSALLLVDLQQRLMPAIHDGAAVVANAVRLAEGAALLEVPVCATEQNPDGLGGTVAELAAFPQLVLPKFTFGAVAEPGFDTLLPPGTEEIVVAGCEAHVCVLQTVLGLLAKRHRVLLVADAIGSRTPQNRSAAIDRMQRHGAEVVTTEMVLFEWLRDSQHPQFRAVQKLIK
jgi:nicotinamidase-related amidase